MMILFFYKFTEIRRKLVDNGFQVDSVSGIPLLHLNFIIKHIFPYTMFYGVRMKPPLLRIGEIYFHHVCHFSNPQSITLRDISRTQKMIKLQMKRQPKISYMIVVLTRNKKAIYDNDFVADDAQVDHVFIDSSNTLPGYCRLRLASSLNFADENVVRIGSNIYQKAFQITETLRSQVDVGRRRKVQYIGVPCKSFPFVRRWKENKRSDFPSGTVIDSIVKNGCTLIPNPHPKSTRPDLEWEFNFSIAETLIFNSLTDGQMHGFLVLNVLLENMTNHLHVPFQTQHLVAVFFLACEELSCRAWDVNFSGCFLYVLGSLLSFLKANFLPDYFIPERNLIDSHRKDDIGTLCCIVEYIRLFPACAVQIVAEKYGYTYGTNLIKRILLNREYFPDRTKFPVIFDESFGPLTIATAKTMAKMGFYGASIQILENRFEQSLLTPQSLLRQSSFNFSDFFMSALMEIKQQSSRVNLARIFDLKMGSNISDLVIETGRGSLQAYLPWAVDARIGWIKVPLDKTGNLIEIASFLYGYSKSEYWKRNAILAEIAVTTSIRCIQETLKENNLNVESIRDLGLSAEVKDENRTLQRKLIPLFVHLYCVSLLDYEIYPLLDYLDDIEDICNLFPEMAGVVSLMFSDAFKPEKSLKYAKMMNAYFQD